MIEMVYLELPQDNGSQPWCLTLLLENAESLDNVNV